jgi:hypothetical protein
MGVGWHRRGSLAALVFACSVAIGCSKSPGSDGAASTPPAPPIAAIPVWFAPDDLMTDVASTPISVDFGSPPPDDVVEAIRAGVAVRTYPGRQAVPFTTTIRTALSAGKDYPPSKYIDIVPQASVGNQWIVLSIASLPDGFKSGSAVPNNEPDLGSVVARIHGSSAPIVRLAQLSGKGATGEATRFSLSFSERIAVTAATLGNYLRVSSSDGTPCSFVAAPNLVGYSTMAFDCPGTSSSSTHVHLTMHAGLKSVSGAALGILAMGACGADPVGPAEYDADLDFTNAAGCSTACKQMSITTTKINPCNQ